MPVPIEAHVTALRQCRTAVSSLHASIILMPSHLAALPDIEILSVVTRERHSAHSQRHDCLCFLATSRLGSFFLWCFCVLKLQCSQTDLQQGRMNFCYTVVCVRVCEYGFCSHKNLKTKQLVSWL